MEGRFCGPEQGNLHDPALLPVAVDDVDDRPNGGGGELEVQWNDLAGQLNWGRQR